MQKLDFAQALQTSHKLETAAQKTWPASTENLSAETCPACQQQLVPVRLPVTGRYVQPVCSCQVEAFEREKELRLARERKERIERLFTHCGLGSRFAGCSFDNWIKRLGTAKAYRTAQNYVQRLEENIMTGRGLLIFGRTGNGKSHLAAAISVNAISAGKSVIFERVPQLLLRVRATYNADAEITERKLFKALGSVELLVLDDAGAEKWTRWTEPTLYTIIDERYSWKKALVITTNCDLDELEQKVGPRTMDRLLEMCDVVENRGTSYRQETAEIHNEKRY